ncbi:hypothetical protein KQX54_019335 [Cotesia glomerata]|uniref:RING-type domain-containing protein n=1 Tax=Cotesia glomerata TaxID=32391 RepID=A0AAV7IRD5_COTGL|nr:hypothetical protein KQX54_019335 [Cotesia glomerata]
MRIQWTSLRNRRIDGTVFLERMLAIHESHYNDMMHNFTVMIDEQLVINGLHIHQLRAGVADNQRNQQVIMCDICFSNRVNMICHPCLHVQMCSQCARQIRQAKPANGPLLSLLSPFCNSQAEFHEARLRNDLDADGFPLMICELCNTHRVNIICTNCFALRICNNCLEIRREENDVIGNICPTCEEEAELRRGFFS